MTASAQTAVQTVYTSSRRSQSMPLLPRPPTGPAPTWECMWWDGRVAECRKAGALHCFARTHAHTHACTHARMHARTHACTHARTHTHMHACTHAHTHTPGEARFILHADVLGGYVGTGGCSRKAFGMSHAECLTLGARDGGRTSSVAEFRKQAWSGSWDVSPAKCSPRVWH